MGNFNRDRGGQGGGGSFRSDGRKPMFQATCSECNKSCEVPFRPTGDKPVYCKDCFAQKGGGEKRFQDDRFPRKDFGDRSSRPHFDNNRRPDQQRPVGGGDDIKRLLENMNTKIERLINSVENLAHMKFNPAKDVLTATKPAVVVVPKPVAAPVKVVGMPVVKAEVSLKQIKKAKEIKRSTVKKAKK
ncbi:MAG: hypothetical protein HY225_03220 [Candidatus Vogelbacteria bacterium]|nr:hypothetical protein [Candidatus Vogelbacteria bacterium]